MFSAQVEESTGKRTRLLPLYFLAFSGDVFLSTIIVSCTLVGSHIAPAWVIGLLGSTFYMTYLPMAILGGRVSDRIGRRTSILINAIGCIGVSILLIVWGQSSLYILFASELATGFFNSFFWPSIEAYISEMAINEQEHQTNVNKFCLSWSLGYMIGPFIAPVLDDIGTLYSFLILLILALVIAFVATVFIPRFVPAKKGAPVPNVSPQGQDHGDSGGILLTMVILTLVIVTYNFATTFFLGVFPDIGKNPTYLGWSGFETGLALFCFGAARSITFVLQNRIKNDTMISGILLALALSLSAFLFLVTPNFVAFCAFFSLSGVLSALVYSMTLQKMLHLPEGRGQSAGIFESGLGLAGLLSPIISGVALDIFATYQAAFITVGTISIIMSAAAFILLAVFSRRK